MAGDPVDASQLLPAPAGGPLAFTCPLGRRIYVYKNAVPKLARKLTGSFAPADNRDPALLAELVCALIGGTLRNVQLITREGALTPLRHPRSFDYLCAGGDVAAWWGDPLVTVIVRRVPAGLGLEAESGPGGSILELVTITPRSRLWKDVIAGAPVSAATQTHLLQPGERLDPALHCLWRKDSSGEALGR